MYRIFFFFIGIILSLIGMRGVFAENGCDIQIKLPTSVELTSSVDRCIAARGSESTEAPNSIIDFTCPQGEFLDATNQPIGAEKSNQILAYSISVNLAFNQADIGIKKYMQKLQKTREADPIKWIENINACTEKIKSIYDGICAFGTLSSLLNAGEKKYITNTNAYPQSLCDELAGKKTQGWEYFQKIMMSDGISKNQKNSTDAWITQVKGAYARVLGSWHTYQKILARAVSKMTGYTKESN